MAKKLIEYLSSICNINKNIWNRTKIDDGIFYFPEGSNDWNCKNRIVLEVGEDLPLFQKVGIQYLASKFIIDFLRN
jgi:hypothetical protein